jgi:signal transduction histidine kinase
MSLRLRLILLIAVLMTLVTMAVAVVHLSVLMNTISSAAYDRSDNAGQQVKAFVNDHLRLHAEDYANPANLEEERALWNEIVSTDKDITNLLEKMMAASTAILEINIASVNGQILSSSNPTRVGRVLPICVAFEDWEKKPAYRRLYDVFSHGPDYEKRVPLGSGSDLVFTIQVVSSNLLLREALLKSVQPLATVSSIGLLGSLLITILASNRLLRPVRRLEQVIDRIVAGKMGGGAVAASTRDRTVKELAVVETKLNLLGEQFQGARQGAVDLKRDFDQLVEQMASQLDVAARLVAISRLTSGVAHEIKNPLNAIALRLDLLKARLGAPPEDLEPEIDVLSKEVLRLDRVVKTFLDFSRPVEVKFQDVNLTELAREGADLMAPTARASHIDVHFETSLAYAPIRGDADLLKQAILNLVTNAIEAMKNGGHIFLRVEKEPGGRVALEVADNGPGIPEELKEKVFQLYFTTKTSGNHRGSGIGLAMTFRAVQLHNGTIGFTSEPGRGTTFRLEFPSAVRHA